MSHTHDNPLPESRSIFGRYHDLVKKTAQYSSPGRNIFYPALGLVGELAEVYELLELRVNDKKKFVDEIGDVLWYIFALSIDLGISKHDFLSSVRFYSWARAHPRTPIPVNSHREMGNLFFKAGLIANSAKKLMRDGDSGDRIQGLRTMVIEMFHELDRLANTLNINLEDAAENNEAKLLGRLERNTIKGDGNDR